MPLIKPPWLRKNLDLSALAPILEVQERLRLNTVCASAACPNRAECHSRRIAAFMINGNTCTRACAFCDVKTGRGEPLDPGEPARVAAAIAELGLRHTVITCVARDDLADGGASGFVRTLGAIRARCPGVTIEVLTSDFRGNAEALRAVVEAGPDIYNYNAECVKRLQPVVRRVATYERTLWLLRTVKRLAPGMLTKSGFMVGLGETAAEVQGLICDLRDAGIDILTIGQYLRPSLAHYPVHEYVHPDVFAEYAAYVRSIGIRHVAAGPYVRSSYLAEDLVAREGLLNRRQNGTGDALPALPASP